MPRLFMMDARFVDQPELVRFTLGEEIDTARPQQHIRIDVDNSLVMVECPRDRKFGGDAPVGMSWPIQHDEVCTQTPSIRLHERPGDLEQLLAFFPNSDGNDRPS